MTKFVGIHEAKTRLSQLLADVAAGEEVVITNRGRPVARLSPPLVTGRTFGTDRSGTVIADDFDAALPEELLRAFGA